MGAQPCLADARMATLRISIQLGLHQASFKMRLFTKNVKKNQNTQCSRGVTFQTDRGALVETKAASRTCKVRQRQGRQGGFLQVEAASEEAP